MMLPVAFRAPWSLLGWIHVEFYHAQLAICLPMAVANSQHFDECLEIIQANGAKEIEFMIVRV
jgi:hypothetical protein